MKVVQFIAESAAAGLVQVHQQLGPEAVVLSVRPLPKHGLARLWPRPGSVEIVAGAWEPPVPDGISPVRSAPGRPAHEGSLVTSRGRLPPLHDGTGRPHVFIGPPGVGKTTLLCKWMAYAVLNQSLTAKVFRLDGVNANTAEFLNVYGEMLAVRIERFWNAGPAAADLCLVDLPGVPAENAEALRQLKQELNGLPAPRIHLVLNAAYDLPVLEEQVRAFAMLEPEDVSLCHLDEEKRQDKLTKFLLGTNCYLRFLSTGQKIPGDFAFADQESELPADLSR